MRRSTGLAIAFGFALSFGATIAATAHEGDGAEKIDVEPSTVPAGESVILAGIGLEPESDRVLVLTGEGLTLDLGTVKTDAEGAFQAELTIPGHVPAGTYELQAIADETLTVEIAILEAEGAPSPAPTATPGADGSEVPGADGSEVPGAAGPAASAPPVDPTNSIVPRQWSTLDIALIVGFVVISGALGGLLIWRAERFPGPAAS